MQLNSAMLIFQLVAFLHNKLVILHPENVIEAFVTTDFSNIIKTPQIKLEWPKDWRRMHVQNINDTGVLVDESDIFLKNFDKPYLYYKLRLIFSNRTVLDLDWIPVLWNSDISSDTYYSQYLTFIIMFTLLLFIFLSLLVIVRYRTYYRSM